MRGLKRVRKEKRYRRRKSQEEEKKKTDKEEYGIIKRIGYGGKEDKAGGKVEKTEGKQEWQDEEEENAALHKTVCKAALGKSGKSGEKCSNRNND